VSNEQGVASRERLGNVHAAADAYHGERDVSAGGQGFDSIGIDFGGEVLK
jgi:hypothetical protein